MASGFVAPTVHNLARITLHAQDAVKNQCHIRCQNHFAAQHLSKYELSNFVFKFSISVPDMTSV